MDHDEELAKAKWLLIALAAFLVTGWLAFSELRYLAFGRTAEARLVEVRESTRSRGRGLGRREEPVTLVTYAYSDDGQPVTVRDVLPAGWTPPDGPLLVQYRPGSEYSARLAGSERWWAVALFLAALTVVGWFGFKLFRQAQEAAHGPPGRSRRRSR